MAKKKYIGAKLYPKQEEIARGIIASKDMWHIVDAGRQVGKSFLCQQLLLYFAINNPGWHCMYVSMTYSQANKIFKRLVKGIRKSNIIREFNRSENSIELINGSEIYFKSYQKADSIRGYDNDLLIIDEAAFCDDEDFQAVFRPTLSVRGKKCILCSSPRGYNYFRDLYNRGVNGDKGYHSYFATYQTCPFSNLDEIEDAKRSLPEKIFRSEYLGEFIDGGMSVFDNYRECVNINVPGGKVIAGIDVGRKDDFTVLTIMNGRKVVYQERWRTDTWENILKNIVHVVKRYRPIATFCEINGVGDVFYEMLAKAWQDQSLPGQLNEWTTTNQSKANIVEKLISDFNSKNISIPDSKVLLQELTNFEATYSKGSRSIIYQARTGHDDTVMSLAICNYQAHHSALLGNYFLT